MKSTLSKITVSGNIISELSEKIPNNIIALNELIKNAYDAGSPSVDITLDTKRKILVVKDYGLGMGPKDIDKLFHISASEKEYGEIIRINGFDRIVQGSKGLGFLSVFKFGKKVKWKTAKNNVALEFSVNFDDLLRLEDITDYPLEVTHKTMSNFIGTEITIDISEYNLVSLEEYFSNGEYLHKVLNSFITEKVTDNEKMIIPDPNFRINLKVNEKGFSTNTSLRIEEEHVEGQFLRVKYNSDNQKINFYYQNKLVHSEQLEFNFREFSINMDLQIFSLKAHGKSKINPLFYNPIDRELTPLLFVNNNLFNNYSIFDTGVMKPISRSQVLPQIIGYISIKSFDKDVNFNSDRTQFTQNKLTDNIIKTVENLNKSTQIIGSQIRGELRNNYILNNLKSISENEIDEIFNPSILIKEDLLLKEFIVYEQKESEIIYKLFENVKSIKIKRNKKETIEKSFELFLGQDPSEILEEINEITDGSYQIIFKSQELKGINWSIPGNWLIKTETDTQNISICISIIEPEQPKIDIKLKDVELHKIYSYDELFSVVNSFDEKDKGISFELETYDNPNVNNQKRKGKLSFNTLDEAKITVSVTDKKTNLSHAIDAYFRVLDPSKVIERQTTKKDEMDFIRMPVSNASNLPQSIKAFINELNELSKSDRFNYTFVSSVRTLVELCVMDILNIKQISKRESLSENYKIVIDQYNDFIGNIEDDKDRQILKNIVQSISSSEDRASFLAFLNLSTHGSSRVVSKSEVKIKTREIGALLEYLNHLNEGLV